MSDGSSGAFGDIPTTTTRFINGTEQRADDRPHLGDWPSDLRDRLTPNTTQILSQFQFVLATAATDLNNASEGAAVTVLNHALNDVLSLIDDVVHCNGRSAARTARAMLEHLVNYADVTTSTEEAERYSAHRYVTEDLIGRRALYFRTPRKRQQPGPTKEQRGLVRQARRPLENALHRYGSRFRRGFATANLKDRTERHGYFDAYDGYRILSGVTHGAAGGAFGTRRELGGGTVHRTGPDLRLAAIAYVEGLTWWCQLLERTADHGTTPRTDLLVSVSYTLRDASPEVFDALQAADHELWPAHPVPPPFTILALFPNNERWYVYRPLEETVTLAVPPIGDDIDRIVTQAREKYADYRPEQYGGRPMTVALSGTQVSERRDTRSVSARGIIVPADIRS